LELSPRDIGIDEIWRSQSRRVLATLIRLLGDFDLAEEALQDAFVAASRQWPREGVPRNPTSWLISAGRFQAIDKLRRSRRFDDLRPELIRQLSEEPEALPDQAISDDHLRLIFTCCHPVLSLEARVALTLREVCGLTTEEIARAFLLRVPAVAQRIVRAKARIRDDEIPYETPEQEHLPDRLDAVLHVIYLVFNEAYSASSGTDLIRSDLAAEAIRLGRLMTELLPDGETYGLLGLMLVHASRSAARLSPDGDIVLLADQDRSLWNQELIKEGCDFVEKAFATRHIGPYTLQAAISAVHASAPAAEETDWRQIIALYDVLLRVAPSPVVRLNRAVAIGMRGDLEKGLALVDALLVEGQLSDYHHAHAARADLNRRLGRNKTALEAYQRALELCRQEPERRFLLRRIDTLAQSF